MPHHPPHIASGFQKIDVGMRMIKKRESDLITPCLVLLHLQRCRWLEFPSRRLSLAESRTVRSVWGGWGKTFGWARAGGGCVGIEIFALSSRAQSYYWHTWCNILSLGGPTQPTGLILSRLRCLPILRAAFGDHRRRQPVHRSKPPRHQHHPPSSPSLSRSRLGSAALSSTQPTSLGCYSVIRGRMIECRQTPLPDTSVYRPLSHFLFSSWSLLHAPFSFRVNVFFFPVFSRLF